MLGKLIKYEFMSMGRIFLPMYGALLAIALVNSLFRLLHHEVPEIISTVVTFLLMFSVPIVGLILVIQSFRKNLLSEEGYLMMTLPLKTDHLILSKMFVATIFSIASFVVVMLALHIGAASVMGLLVNFERLILDLLHDWFGNMSILNLTVLMLLIILSTILLLYSCMALSLLVNNKRGLFSFGAFVVITTLMQILIFGVAAIVFYSGIYERVVITPFWASLTTNIWLIGACIIYYLITRFMLKRRLNLL